MSAQTLTEFGFAGLGDAPAPIHTQAISGWLPGDQPAAMKKLVDGWAAAGKSFRFLFA